MGLAGRQYAVGGMGPLGVVIGQPFADLLLGFGAGFKGPEVYLVLQVLFAGIRGLIDRHQPHEPHQTTHTVAATFMTLSLHVTGHPLPGRGLLANHERGPRAIPRRIQKLLVDDFVNGGAILGHNSGGIMRSRVV